MKAFYLTCIALGLFKETDTELYLIMYDKVKISKLDALELDLSAKEKHFLKVIKNHVSYMFMSFVQGNRDVTADSIMKVLSVERQDVYDNERFYIDASSFLFNKILQLMTKSELVDVLKFATGMETIPVFPEFRFKLVSQTYPTTWFGHTCFYSLDMSDNFKEITNKFAEALIDAYIDYEKSRADRIEAEKKFIYETNGYDFPGKVRKEKERLIEHISSSGTTSQSDTCVRDSAPVVASVPIEATSPMASPEPITPRTPERPISSPSASPPRIRRPVTRYDPSRRDRLESVVSSILDFYEKE